MKQVLEQIVANFQEFSIPELHPRLQELAELRGKVSTVIGMRRAGKTFFCYQQMKRHLDSGWPQRRMLYVNFEDERLLPFATGDFDALLNVYYAQVPEAAAEPCRLYFDEIQRVPGWELFVRRMLDEGRFHITLTGSSSKLLSREIATSLRGRALSTEIFPLSFREYLLWRGTPPPEPGPVGVRKKSDMVNALSQYMESGGFPEVIGLERPMRRNILQGYLDVVILRDVVERHSVSNVAALRALLRQVLHAPANPFSVNRFAGQLRSMGVPVAKNALYEFVDHLADAFLLYPVEVHARSVRKRQVNPRKMYAVDVGLLQAVSFAGVADRGAMLENLVYLSLRRRGIQPDYYLTSSGREVDFVYENEEGKQELVQVCWSVDDSETRQRELRALHEALQECSGASARLVTWMDEGEVEAIETTPAWRWLLAQASPPE